MARAMVTPDTTKIDTRNALLVLPLHLMVVNATYWQVCVEDQRHCVGIFDDMDAALARAIELAEVRIEAGKPTRVLARRSRDGDWMVAWPETKHPFDDMASPPMLPFDP